jgi:hypothetical protein
MKIIQMTFIAATIIASLSSGALAQTRGDWVLANYKGAGYWFPGVIASVNGSKVTVQYDDGDRETLPISETKPYDWAIGKKVECNYKGQGKWYSGTIASLGGAKIGIAYDDGDQETTNTGRCRSR